MKSWVLPIRMQLSLGLQLRPPDNQQGGARTTKKSRASKDKDGSQSSRVDGMKLRVVNRAYVGDTVHVFSHIR
jgi:hypothetical protein